MTTATAPQVLQGLRRAGFVVGRKGENLTLTPSEKLTPDIRAAVLAVKPALLELLSEYPPILCWACGDELAESQPRGHGPVRIGQGYFHIATCLPESHLYDPATGRVDTMPAFAGALLSELGPLFDRARQGRASYTTPDSHFVDANAWAMKAEERLQRIRDGRSTIERDGLLKIAGELREAMKHCCVENTGNTEHAEGERA